MRSLLLLVLVSVGCSHTPRLRDARGPQLSSTLRTLRSGPVVGYQEKNGALAWLGIPYARPPTGLLRWKAPRPVAHWTAPRDATRFGRASGHWNAEQYARSGCAKTQNVSLLE
ncbi:MAG: carboxylesterase family protein [Myxococcaceae bacterium]